MQGPELGIIDHSGLVNPGSARIYFLGRILLLSTPPATEVFPEATHADGSQTVFFGKIGSFYSERGIHELQIIDHASLGALEKVHAGQQDAKGNYSRINEVW